MDELSLFLEVLWVGQFVSIPHRAEGWTNCLSFLRYFGSVSLSRFLIELWVGRIELSLSLELLLVVQFVSLPHSAVGWTNCLSFSRYLGLDSWSLFLIMLWVGQFVSLTYSAVGFFRFVSFPNGDVGL